MPLPTPVILGLMFITLGSFDGMIGVMWPTLAESLDRSIGDLGILLAAYLVASMTGSLSANWVMQRIGLNAGLFWASIMTVSAIGLIVWANSWLTLLAAFAIRGLGNGAIHTYLNTYAGKTLSNRKLMAVHSCWGAGAALAAMTMTYLVANEIAWQFNLMWCVAPALVAIASYRYLPRLSPPTAERHRLPMTRLDWFAVATTGLYVAVEASVGNWAFTLMTQGWNTSVEFAGTVTSIFWALLTVFRILLSLTPVSANGWLRSMPKLLALSPVILALGVISPWLGAAGVIAAGIASSVIFPNAIFRGVNNATEKNQGKVTGFMLTSAAAGGAGGPAIMGVIAGAGALLWIPLPMALLGIAGAYVADRITRPGSTDATPAK